MLSTITHSMTEDAFKLFMENNGIIVSQYFKTISTSQDGSFNNKSYRPFVLEIDTSIIDTFEGKPCFYIPGYSEVYLDKYALFNPRFLWEWEIFFTKSIPIDYIHTIYVVSDGNEHPNENLIEEYENEYGIAYIDRYDYSEREDYWGNALGYKNSLMVSYILDKHGLDYENINEKLVMDYIDEVNMETAMNTNTEKIYGIIINENNYKINYIKIFR